MRLTVTGNGLPLRQLVAGQGRTVETADRSPTAAGRWPTIGPRKPVAAIPRRLDRRLDRLLAQPRPRRPAKSSPTASANAATISSSSSPGATCPTPTTAANAPSDPPSFSIKSPAASARTGAPASEPLFGLAEGRTRRPPPNPSSAPAGSPENPLSKQSRAPSGPTPPPDGDVSSYVHFNQEGTESWEQPRHWQ